VIGGGRGGRWEGETGNQKGESGNTSLVVAGCVGARGKWVSGGSEPIFGRGSKGQTLVPGG